MSPVRERSDDDTIRTHIDEVGRRLEGQVKAVHARVGEVDKALRERVDSRSAASLERYERHAKQDEREIGEIKAAMAEMKETARESQKEIRGDVKEMGTKLDALLIKDAGQTGKLAGVVVAATAAVGMIGWLLDRFVLPH